MEREWELRAICRREDPEVWFSRRTAARAKQLCLKECPVREECLEAILAREAKTANSMRAGIIAGLTGAERAKLAASRSAKAPVKKPQAAPPGPGRPQAPCGTRSAYQRHLRKKEPVCAACRAANARSGVQYRRTGSSQVPAAR
ncbi:WhiB family transcriptional regulator [Streptomyces sp. NPDC004658]|uniref:WhiB family transcriptional regulator n=1 Tax=Streptomyces sp. NPDC004658 TaxID=3154672 RepID=UPI0033B64001